jgi:hypothetical protein
MAVAEYYNYYIARGNLILDPCPFFVQQRMLPAVARPGAVAVCTFAIGMEYGGRYQSIEEQKSGRNRK